MTHSQRPTSFCLLFLRGLSTQSISSTTELHAPAPNHKILNHSFCIFEGQPFFFLKKKFPSCVNLFLSAGAVVPPKSRSAHLMVAHECCWELGVGRVHTGAFGLPSSLLGDATSGMVVVHVRHFSKLNIARGMT